MYVGNSIIQNSTMAHSDKCCSSIVKKLRKRTQRSLVINS